ncbi:prolyl oligopeptidase family serine peptidase [Dyadobacter sp. CY107]|uniref:prolyl oligopeptidase family serine peptidase n=1 Tax=Dyadobacter fanqingshengii TaxID=2906443 RepID=UPI001F30F061|nr:prolyl oligopeptidase family serine peptidase [Dyadobacter fanqingshengii]MCF2505717.1 prolyl oligopeptidase family serine peptidase [Dyadobacter fanqingshengii]
MKLKFTLIVIFGTIQFAHAQSEDPYLWLEEVDSKKSLEFVEKQNKLTIEKLGGQTSYQPIYDKSLEIYNSTDRIPDPSIQGGYIYNFWQDKEHVRGIWRRSTKASYLSGKPVWDILLDLDGMHAKDSIKWVFKGASGLFPDYNRFMVSLSKGGGDATVIREFDPKMKTFIENGFSIPESKGDVSYLDVNTLIVSSDFGSGTMTTSGYPRQIKLWKRGTELRDARLIFQGDSADVGSFGFLMRDDTTKYLMISRIVTFFATRTFVWVNNKAVPLNVPDDSQISGILKNQLILSLRSDWKLGGAVFKQGAVIGLNFKSLLAGKQEPLLIFQPDEFSSVSQLSFTKNRLLLNLLTNVKSELYAYAFANKTWTKQKVDAPDFGALTNGSADEFSDQYFFYFTNFLKPSTLYVADAKLNTVKAYKSLPDFFDASKYKVDQVKAKSADGTLIPYFVIASKTLDLNGKNPTLLYAYGGFEVSEVPFYSGVMGNAWLDNGGVYVLANIRGGGEYGPKWHQAGLKEKRQNVYDDFHAVAQDVITKKITSSRNLGIIGGSNGGLLVGAAFTQRPDLYNAVVCAVPLLDMKRYNKLLAGASWMGEYGDPDKPEEWEYIKKYSPYHNLKKDAKYPEVFFTTSTRDDRVHPGHARKMVAKMLDMGYTIYYFENTEGGHAGSSTNEQRAKTSALQYSYLLMKLKE